MSNAIENGRTYTHAALIGEGRAVVYCFYEMSSDGDVEDLLVEFNNVDITPTITMDTYEDLCAECYQAYVKEAKQSNDDLAIMRWESSQEAV